jgi:CheY-like chemotaxis protein
MIRVLVADDHPVVRAAVLDLLHETDGVCAIGEAVDGQEAIDLAGSARPNVVLMDVSMPNLSGLEATRLLTADCPGIRVLIIQCRVPAERSPVSSRGRSRWLRGKGMQGRRTTARDSRGERRYDLLADSAIGGRTAAMY